MREKIKKHSKKAAIGIVGGIVTLVGLVLIPYPGPGWLIVFAGLAILATEFEFAQNILDKLRVRYDEWRDWLKKQNTAVQLTVFTGVCLITITTVYLLNGFGIINDFLDLGLGWLKSPFVK